jgi:hypothetical protein
MGRRDMPQYKSKRFQRKQVYRIFSCGQRTSAAEIDNAKLKGRMLSFTLNDVSWSHCRMILAGVSGEPVITVDGEPLQRVSDLEERDESTSRTERGQVLIKVKQTGRPRNIVVRLS